MTPVADLNELRRAIGVFLEPGSVIELRAPKTERDGVIAGYFSDGAALLQAVRSIDSKAPGIYVTLNPVSPTLQARAVNRVKPRMRELTGDGDVVRRRLLLLDFDPVRPAGMSSTHGEHEAALDAAMRAAQELGATGWPAPVYADSGNGGHLVYLIDLPNDDDSTSLVKTILLASHQRWTNAIVNVDRTVFNASRISKIYGSVARKGDSTEERPHRISRIIDLPEQLVSVPVLLLREFGATAVAAQKTAAPGSFTPRGPISQKTEFDLERWLADHNVAIHRGPEIHEGSERWILDACPFNPSHLHPDASVWRNLASGRLGFKCLHDSCEGKHWADFRAVYEPLRSQYTGPYRERSRPTPPAGAPSGRPVESDSDTEIPGNAADVEAAVTDVIAQNDLAQALRLVSALATLRPMFRAVEIAKLREHFKKRWPSREFNEALRDAMSAAAAGSNPPPDDDDEAGAGLDGEGPDLRPFPCTDAGNGERIVVMHGINVRYCGEMKKWLVWDGKRWAVDHHNITRRMAKDMARLLYRQALRDGSESLKHHARESESYRAITAALGSAATEPGIPITAAELDQHPFLFNCPNGVIDLRNGKMMPHNRDFLITKLCPIPFDPEARAERFKGFVERAMGANPEADEIGERTARLVGFLQRAFGYALTADVSEKVLFIFHGERGDNGKTTLLTVFRELLGKDYSGQLSIDTVMSSKGQDSTARADLADLRGLRLVVTSEVEREHKLGVGKIKYITGGMGEIKSCRKYENPIEFLGTHKLFMDCNFRPVIRESGDEAIWNRVRLVPFTVTIPKAERDKRLIDKLRREFPGILAWAVRGCAEWQRLGELGVPPEVQDAVQEWREHDDPLKEFLDDRCQTVPDQPGDEMHVAARDLTEAYSGWAQQTREKFPLGREALNERLLSKGFKQGRSRRDVEGKQYRSWEGIQLRQDQSWASKPRATSFSADSWSMKE